MTQTTTMAMPVTARERATITHATKGMTTFSVATLKCVHVTFGVEVLVSPGHGHEIERTASLRRCVEGRDLVRVHIDPGDVRVLARRGPRIIWCHGIQLDPTVSVTSKGLVGERNGRMVDAPCAHRHDVHVSPVFFEG